MGNLWVILCETKFVCAGSYASHLSPAVSVHCLEEGVSMSDHIQNIQYIEQTDCVQTKPDTTGTCSHRYTPGDGD